MKTKSSLNTTIVINYNFKVIICNIIHTYLGIPPSITTTITKIESYNWNIRSSKIMSNSITCYILLSDWYSINFATFRKSIKVRYTVENRTGENIC